MPVESDKYRSLLDPEYWDYIDEVKRCFPPELSGRPISEQRKVYDAMCRAFHGGSPAQVRALDMAAPSADGSIPLRIYSTPGSSASALLLYFHGGGFILGGLESHDDICAEICAGAKLKVASVDYRLAPENPHPASFLDAVAAYQWLSSQGVAILLCGESAGGNLAAAVVHARRGDPQLMGQVLIYPDLGGETGSGSYIEHSHAPLLSATELASYRGIRAGGATELRDPTLWPLRDTDFSGLPSTIAVTAECDPLSDDGKNYASRLVAAGSRAHWRNEPRLTHSFLRARRTVPRARVAFDAIIADIEALAGGRWLY